MKRRRNARKTAKNYEKIAYLERYRAAVNAERRIADSLATLETVGAKSPLYDGMPHSQDTERDLSDFMVKIDKELSRLLRKKQETVQLRQEIEAVITSLSDETERMVLWLRYIRFYSWEMVAVEISHEYRYVLKLHGSALNHISIPENKTYKDT